MNKPGNPRSATASSPASEVNGRYAWYVLSVLFMMYVFLQMDRYILSILAEDVKKSFALTDSELGFLGGTAYAVFYALFGYPVARLADRWSRVKLLTIGLSFWSIMTALCGGASSFLQLAICRMGVGIGESTGAPVAYSLISDWFSKDRRATAFGLLSAGLTIGSGLALILGGFIVTRWNILFPNGKPLGLEGWRVTFFAFGISGLILALWLATLREPKRGQADGLTPAPETRIWNRLFDDACGILPPLTLYGAAQRGRNALLGNLAAGIAVAATAALLIILTGDVLQWSIVGVGFYAAFSASRSLRHHDRPTFALTWGTPAFLFAVLGFGSTSMVNHITSFWLAPLAIRNFGIDRATVGLFLGSTAAIGGAIGMIGGGRLSDFMLTKSPLGRFWVGIAAPVISFPLIVTMCLTSSSTVFFACFVPFAIIGPAWVACGAATVQDLVLPRMRGTATNVYFLVATLVGTGLGPYVVGKISNVSGSLSTGLLSTLIVVHVAAIGFLSLSARSVVSAEASKLSRAAAVGEPAPA